MTENIRIRRLKKADVPILYKIALRAFQRDFEKFGVYPPLLRQEKKAFLPPVFLGRSIFLGDTLIGGAFLLALGKKGEIGALFLDPDFQCKGYGGLALNLLEQSHPRVKRWTLETPAESPRLHEFYEGLGYRKVKERVDKASGMYGIVYEKYVK